MDIEKLKKLNESGMTQKEMTKELNVSRSTIQKYLRKLNLHTINKHNALKFDNTIFDVINTEEKAYWLGFLYADGSISKDRNNVELSLSDKDIDHVTRFKDFCKTIKEVKTSIVKVNDKSFTRCRLCLTDKHLKQRLIQLGCIPQKSLILTFPNYEQVPKHLIKHFIRGYIDGDGCISYTKTGRLHLQIIGTESFLNGIMNEYPDIFCKIHKDKRWKNNTFYISCSCNPADKILTDLYKNATIFLKRKYDRLAVLSSNW